MSTNRAGTPVAHFESFAEGRGWKASFGEPCRQRAVYALDEVLSLLSDAETAAQEGMWVALALSYEARGWMPAKLETERAAIASEVASGPTHLGLMGVTTQAVVTTHCARTGGSEIESMAEPFPAISLPWMEQDPSTGRIHISWHQEREDGSWTKETATLEPGESHVLLELCRESVADFDRRTRDTATD
jgi:hypothetical protein